MVVQKFGGTSVDRSRRRSTPDRNRPRDARARDGRGPVLVVSAMSGVTDALLTVAAEAGAVTVRERPGCTLRAIARASTWRWRVPSWAMPWETPWQTDQETQSVALCVAQAATQLWPCSPRISNSRSSSSLPSSRRWPYSARCPSGRSTLSPPWASCSAHASSRLRSCTPALPGEWMDARRAIVTNDDHTRAIPLMRETAAALRASVLPVVEAGRIPVLGGFVGATLDGHTTTLGRGGSDYSGCHRRGGASTRRRSRSGPTWTECSPRIRAWFPRSRLVPRLSFAEAAELSYFGAKVLHPSTIHPAVERNIPVRILNSRKPDGEGTLITADPAPGGDRAHGDGGQARSDCR